MDEDRRIFVPIEAGQQVAQAAEVVAAGAGDDREAVVSHVPSPDWTAPNTYGLMVISLKSCQMKTSPIRESAYSSSQRACARCATSRG